MRYIVIRSDSAAGLTNEVNDKIVQGWEPIGGVFVETYHMVRSYYQAMVFYDPPVSG